MDFLKTIKLKRINKPVLVLDGDSVILDWFGGFTSFLNEKGICTKHVEHFHGTTNFIPTEQITGISCKKISQSLMNEFSNTDWLERLPTFQKGTDKHLHELEKHYNIVVLTCIGESEEIKNKRIKNLKSLYGDIFSGIICINYNTSKEKHLSVLQKNFNVKAFIDDRIGHIEEAIRAGVNPILFSRGSKEEPTPEDFLILKCWSEISHHLNPSF